MPKAQEEALKKVAAGLAKKGKLKRKAGESLQQAKNAFVYGTIRRMNPGWKPSREKR